MTLLRRYGVVFLALAGRGGLAGLAGVLRTFHRLEARGEFVAGGLSVVWQNGSAPCEAIPLLREYSGGHAGGSLVAVCGVDPLNLAGTLLPSAGAGEQSVGVSGWVSGGGGDCRQTAVLAGLDQIAMEQVR